MAAGKQYTLILVWCTFGILLQASQLASAEPIVLDFELGLSGTTSTTGSGMFIDDPSNPLWPNYASQGTTLYGGLNWTGGDAVLYGTDTGDYSVYAPLDGALFTQRDRKSVV